MWYKDSEYKDLATGLREFRNDRDTLDMVRLAKERGSVELYVVHNNREEEGFSEIGYVDVGGDEGGGHVGCGEEGEVGADGGAGEEPASHDDADFDAAEGAYVSSDEVSDSADDMHFTDSDDDLGLDKSGFRFTTHRNDGEVIGKGKKALNADFSGDFGDDNEDLDGGYDQYDGDEDKDETVVKIFPVHKPIEDMARFYAVKMNGEATWQLRSMNLKHNCKQVQRVGIMHAKWLGKGFKKKVELNPKVKIKDLVVKADRK
ncbi:hypothetical protein PIB30_023580 [Stylosanthes scabra]|uniref:Transposase MuDR plant domain-containing protein n=1 Tax=Stylosanthes scabra TaxID=79078 RepID=A0ABU6X9Q4_9FABA|nr:hypothetical protein [Stylosanthes scabra]